MPLRTQLSLFAPRDAGSDIEAIRRIADPVQSRLIPAHVTLCREDELDGHGLLMPCIGGTEVFQSLRDLVLAARRARLRNLSRAVAY